MPATLDTAWDERMARGRNSFDAVRLTLAMLVVLEHSYFLLDGHWRNDPLFRLSGGQLQFGQLAVYLFFALSGFLVTRSLQQSRSVGWFLARQIARIGPGFLVASLAGALVVGPLAADSVGRYLEAQRWPMVIVTALALKQITVTHTLADNPVPLVHGTLWSIKYEFDCYLILALLGMAGTMRRQLLPVTFAALGVLAVLGWVLPEQLPAVRTGSAALVMSSPDRWPELFPFFFLGAGLHEFRAHVPLSAWLGAAAAGVWIASIYLGGAYWASLFCSTYAVLAVCLLCHGETRLFGRHVDLSYGVYLFGWPVQQLLVHAYGPMWSPVGLFAAAMLATLAVAFASWTWVELPSQRFVRGLERRRAEAVKATT